MTYSMLLTVLKGGSGSGNFGHAGRPGIKGGSARSSKFPPLRDPSDVTQIGAIVRANVDKFELMRKRTIEDMGWTYVKPERQNTRVPGAIQPKTGMMLVHSLPGSHNDMVSELIKDSQYKRNEWVDSVTRFGLVYDKNFETVKNIQFHQGATGVDLNDVKFQDKSMKRIYSTMDRLKKLGIPAGTPVEIELEELDSKGHQQIIDTTL